MAVETIVSGTAWTTLSLESAWRAPAALVAGVLVGTISSLLGVAGGEFIIPILIFIFGTDIKTAGTASVLISLPIVFTGVARHWFTRHYRSQSMLTYLDIAAVCQERGIAIEVGDDQRVHCLGVRVSATAGPALH